MSTIESAKIHLVLASQSPRRKELLGHLGIPFSVAPSNIEEKSQYTDPARVVCDLAYQKGMDALKGRSDSGDTTEIIVSSDTLVVLRGEILGKPSSQEEARSMLKRLSGKTHQVYSAVCLLAQDRDGSLHKHDFHVRTEVDFDPIDEDTLEHYLSTGESMDKAGAYGIQGAGLVFVSNVRGSYSNVVGFPLNRFLHELKLFVGAEEDLRGEWRKRFV